MIVDREAGLVYRILRANEYERLVPLMESVGLPVPDPELATAAVAIDAEGEVVGVRFLRLMWEGGPFAYIPRKNVSYRQLGETLEQGVKQAFAAGGVSDFPGLTYYTFVEDSPRALAAAKACGMEPIEGCVIHKKEIR